MDRVYTAMSSALLTEDSGAPTKGKLAFYRMDQSMVTDYPLVTIPELDWKPEKGQSRMATPAPEKYPMAGETSHKVTVGVYDLKTGKILYLKAGDPTDRYFTNIAWSPDSKDHLYVRAQPGPE
jgi:dipeptidyl-peptidase-4